MRIHEDAKRTPPFAAMLSQLFGAALAEVEITNCTITSRDSHFEEFQDEGGLGAFHQIQPAQEVVVEGVVVGSKTPELLAVFQQHQAELSFHLTVGVPGGSATHFTIRRTVPGGDQPLTIPPTPALDAAQADPVFKALPDAEQVSAGRFLGRVDAPDAVPRDGASIAIGRALDSLAGQWAMQRHAGETDQALRQRLKAVREEHR